MIIDNLKKNIHLKIVYFGPALSGKTASLKKLFNLYGKIDDVLSIENSINTTLMFDYGVIKLQAQSWNLKFHIYTTTGENYNQVLRPTVLKAIDGLIFVVDPQNHAYKRNIDSCNELKSYFKELFNEIPIIIAFNKLDLPNKFNFLHFLKEIDYYKYENIEIQFTNALNGTGILSSFLSYRLYRIRLYSYSLIR